MQYFSGLGKVGIDKQRRFNMERVLQINLVRFNMERTGACAPERATPSAQSSWLAASNNRCLLSSSRPLVSMLTAFHNV